MRKFNRTFSDAVNTAKYLSDEVITESVDLHAVVADALQEDEEAEEESNPLAAAVAIASEVGDDEEDSDLQNIEKQAKNTLRDTARYLQ